MKGAFRFCAAALGLALLTGVPAEAATTLRLGTDQVRDFFTTVALREFADQVSRETGGGVRIEVYDGGQLGQEKACIEQVQFGALDMAKTSLSPLSEFVPGLNVMNFPYLFRSMDHMWNVLLGDIGRELLDQAGDAQMVALCWLDSGSRNFYGKRPLRDLPDFAGLKIRVPESRIMMGMVDALGGHATPMPSNDVYSSLQTGVCDAAENTIPRYLDMSHQEIAPFLTIDMHNIVPETLLISQAAWNGLTPDEQKAVNKAAAALTENTRGKLQSVEDEVLARLAREFNVTIIRPDAAVIARLRQACQPIYDEYGKEYADIVRRIEAVK